VPVDTCVLKVMYVFVSIHVDLDHFERCIRENFAPTDTIAFVSTIQFAPSVAAAKQRLAQPREQPVAADGVEQPASAEDGAEQRQYSSEAFTNLDIPQAKPLSQGEILGCTSPVLPGPTTHLLYFGDGRFHLESAMIHNPSIPAYRYDPYSKVLSRQHYDHDDMKATRRAATEAAAEVAAQRGKFGLILGTLGRQGNPRILDRLKALFEEHQIPTVTLLLSEIFPGKLEMFTEVECWVQVACPRLSIDWGQAYSQPLLTPYEAEVALGRVAWRELYPMDYYARDEKGFASSWANYHRTAEEVEVRAHLADKNAAGTKWVGPERVGCSDLQTPHVAHAGRGGGKGTIACGAQGGEAGARQREGGGGCRSERGCQARHRDRKLIHSVRMGRVLPVRSYTMPPFPHAKASLAAASVAGCVRTGRRRITAARSPSPMGSRSRKVRECHPTSWVRTGQWCRKQLPMSLGAT
jgi:diphthamide biosynthesis enzyme Dph1/Dph2-like protein